MPVNLPIGATNSGSNDWSDVHGEDQAIVDFVDTLETSVDANFDAITGAYGSLFAAEGPFHAGTSATYILGMRDLAAGAPPSNPSGNSVAINAYSSPPIFYVDDADYAVSGKTPKFRIRAIAACNATAPTVNFVVGLYPVTVAGATTNTAFTLGTVVSGSTVTFTTPSASTMNQGNSGDFNVPSDGAYMFGVAQSGTPASNSRTTISATLQLRWV